MVKMEQILVPLNDTYEEVQVISIQNSEDIKEYYVNVLLFSATILCYVILVGLIIYPLWKFVGSVIWRLMTRCCAKRDEDCSIPYDSKSMLKELGEIYFRGASKLIYFNLL